MLQERRERDGVVGGKCRHRRVALPETGQHRPPDRVGQRDERAIEIYIFNQFVNYYRTNASCQVSSCVMTRTLSVLVLATLLTLAVTVRAQFDNAGQDKGLTTENGVSFINPGSPTVPEAQARSKPVPRLPDGKIDLTGPWVGGGTVNDIEKDGGLKPGELPVLPWAQELRSKRRSQDDPYTACLPMSVLRTNPYPWKFAMAYTDKGLSHIYVLHERSEEHTSELQSH